jgi:hypothetical protein
MGYAGPVKLFPPFWPPSRRGVGPAFSEVKPSYQKYRPILAAKPAAGILAGPMSDKTKFYADQSRIQRHVQEQAARDAAKGDTRPRCRCGLTYTDVPVLWAVEGKDRWAPTEFYCPACLPDKLRELVRQAP